jgi:hypothetical protein
MAGIRERDKRAMAGSASISGFVGVWEFRTTFVPCSQYVLFGKVGAVRI